jgi:hypothetical protein
LGKKLSGKKIGKFTVLHNILYYVFTLQAINALVNERYITPAT